MIWRSRLVSGAGASATTDPPMVFSNSEAAVLLARRLSEDVSDEDERKLCAARL